MKALSGVHLYDRAAIIGDVLVVADLHVGRGAASSVDLPVGEGAEMLERVEMLCERFEPAEVVVAGDLLHSFRTIPGAVEGTVAGLAAAVRDVGARLIVTPGNHDTMLDSVWSGPTTDEYRVGDTIVCHGHVEPTGDAERYVIGHDHPTITIEGQRHHCFLAATDVYRGADLLVLPTFNRLVSGVEINGMRTGDFMSPLITDADALAPIVRDDAADETLEFPPLGEFRHRL